MNGTEIDRHLSDGDILRYIDREAADSGAGSGHATEDERQRWHRHIEDCPRCADAARSLEADSRAVSDWLDRASFESDGADSDGPEAVTIAGESRHGPAAVLEASTETLRAAGTRRGRRPFPLIHRSPWLRAAAILVLLAAPVAAIPAVRSWVVERVVGGEEAAVAEQSAAAAPAEPTVLRFVPSAGEFEVRFEPETRGALEVQRSSEPEAMLSAVGGDPEATVSASTLRIRNPEPGRYQLRVPGGTTSVLVRIGEREVAVREGRIDRGTVVELQPR